MSNPDVFLFDLLFMENVNKCPKDKDIGLEIFYRIMIKQLILLIDFYTFYESSVKNFLL